MIDFVRGPLIYKQEQSVIIEAGGIGYQIFVPVNLSFAEHDIVLLYTHFVVREDAHSLYGFPTIEERDLFRLLLDVSGVGPKAGMAMLSSGDPQELVTAVQLENVKFLTKMPGIGKKTAQRIILDLKDKLKKWGWNLVNTDQASESMRQLQSNANEQEATEALIALGYNEEEAQLAVTTAIQSQDEQLATEELIRQALQASLNAKR